MKLSPSTVARRASLNAPVTAAFSVGYKLLAGVDEVGAGALAGPVVAAAVSLRESHNSIQVPDLDDSKCLSKTKRTKIYQALMASTDIEYCISVIPSITIDKVNILNARLTAMRKAVMKLGNQPDLIFVDGDKALPEIDYTRQLVMINGDSRVSLISAASIIAKVTRDRLMTEKAKQFPQYQFDNHFGYGTKAHLSMLQLYGPCEIHRFSFRPVAIVYKKLLDGKK